MRSSGNFTRMQVTHLPELWGSDRGRVQHPANGGPGSCAAHTGHGPHKEPDALVRLPGLQARAPQTR